MPILRIVSDGASQDIEWKRDDQPNPRYKQRNQGCYRYRVQRGRWKAMKGFRRHDRLYERLGARYGADSGLGGPAYAGGEPVKFGERKKSQ